MTTVQTIATWDGILGWKRKTTVTWDGYITVSTMWSTGGYYDS